MANSRCVWRNAAVRRAREAKMWRGVALALVVVAACVGARADELPARPELLTACIAEAGNDRTALEACQGLIANDCIATEGLSTSSTVLCWSAESDAWDAVIGRASTQMSERWTYKDPMR